MSPLAHYEGGSSRLLHGIWGAPPLRLIMCWDSEPRANQPHPCFWANTTGRPSSVAHVLLSRTLAMALQYAGVLSRGARWAGSGSLLV